MLIPVFSTIAGFAFYPRLVNSHGCLALFLALHSGKCRGFWAGPRGKRFPFKAAWLDL